MVSGTPTGILGWISTYGQYVAFVVQLLFYIVLAIAALWATLLFRKLVNAQVGTPVEAPVADTAAEKPSADLTAEPSVDEFVD